MEFYDWKMIALLGLQPSEYAWRWTVKQAYKSDKYYCGDLLPMMKCVVLQTTKKNWPQIEITMNNKNM